MWQLTTELAEAKAEEEEEDEDEDEDEDNVPLTVQAFDPVLKYWPGQTFIKTI